MRKIITYGGYFEAFMKTLSAKEQRKVDYVVSLLASQNRLPTKFTSISTMNSTNCV